LKDVFWIDGADHLSIVLRPRGGDWLNDEMRRIKASGIETVVSLLEPFEAETLGLGEEPIAAEQAGLRFLSFPIPDTQVPIDMRAFRAFIQSIADQLQSGGHVGVHCRGCIGRATITSACALIHLGWNPRDALDAIATARGVSVPDTEEQERWILNYRATP